MLENSKKWDIMIREANVSKEELIEISQMKGFIGLENIYDYIMKNGD